MSALVSTARLEKMDRKYQVKSDLGGDHYAPAEKPTWLAQLKEDSLCSYRVSLRDKLESAGTKLRFYEGRYDGECDHNRL